MDSLEIHNDPLLGINVISTTPASLEIFFSQTMSIEMNLSLIGPRGEKGDIGPSVDLTPIIGNPNTDFALLYAINKL